MAGEGDGARLLERARVGDEEALAELLRRAAPRLRRALAGRVPAAWRGVLSEEDVLQETFADAFLEIGRFVPAGEGAFEAWLVRMAQNNLTDALRYLGAERRGGRAAAAGTGGEASAEALLAGLTARSRSSPSRHARREEAARMLEAALARLPEDHARVVRLYDLEGRGIDEVAAALGRSPGAAYLLRHRALARLRGWLGESPGSA